LGKEQRGLEKTDAIFVNPNQPSGSKGFSDVWKEEDSVKCKEFCIKSLKEQAKKKKIIYFANLGNSLGELKKETQKALEYYATALGIVQSIYGETNATIASLLCFMAIL